LVEVLGGLATRLTAEKIASDKGRETFKRAFQTLMAVEHGSDFFAIVRAREAFFEVIGRLSENRELLRVWPAAPLQIARLQVRDSFIDIEARRFEEYRRIGEAILKGDGPQAEKAMREHVDVSIRTFKKLPDQTFAVGASLKRGPHK
jgi:DNA-binding GntR family transcriptional regulator